MPRDIFDLTDVSDLPRDLRPKKQGYGRRNSRAEQIFRAAGRPLTNSEFRVAYYRRFGVAMAHNLVGGYLSTNARRGLIVRIARGVYAAHRAAPAREGAPTCASRKEGAAHRATPAAQAAKGQR